MQKVVVLLSLVSLSAFAQAGESFKLLLSDINAEAIISYLDSEKIEVTTARPFAEYQHSERLLKALASYAAFMQASISQGRENIRNANTTRVEEGGPYQRKFVELGANNEVVVRVDRSFGPLVFSPGHPDADAKGMVSLPNVNVDREFEILRAAKVRHQMVMSAIEELEPKFVAADYSVGTDAAESQKASDSLVASFAVDVD